MFNKARKRTRRSSLANKTYSDLEPLPNYLGEYRGSDGTLTGLTRGKGLSADANGHSSGRAKALHRLERGSTAAYFTASGLTEGWGDMSASAKT
jgi:hypothetical protein